MTDTMILENELEPKSGGYKDFVVERSEFEQYHFRGGARVEWTINGGSITLSTTRYGISIYTGRGGNNANVIVTAGGRQLWEKTDCRQDGVWHSWVNSTTFAYSGSLTVKVEIIFDRSGAGDPRGSESFTIQG
ncbi:hypothetical protein [Pseudomonas sp. dw_612]|uniref:hypothetical protein n=1 Tax=Pseudomonas sp. dw_612 TaxID=2720080 RepID=UPI001BD3D7CD|nr:hypothetical protein [Pseudomonas sp. dw_612]